MCMVVEYVRVCVVHVAGGAGGRGGGGYYTLTAAAVTAELSSCVACIAIS